MLMGVFVAYRTIMESRASESKSATTRRTILSSSKSMAASPTPLPRTFQLTLSDEGQCARASSSTPSKSTNGAITTDLSLAPPLLSCGPAFVEPEALPDIKELERNRALLMVGSKSSAVIPPRFLRDGVATLSLKALKTESHRLSLGNSETNDTPHVAARLEVTPPATPGTTTSKLRPVLTETNRASSVMP